MNSLPAPLHALELRISIGAHTPEYAIEVLEELARALQDARLVNRCSGGWQGSYSVTRFDRDITADQYREELEAWSEK